MAILEGFCGRNFFNITQPCFYSAYLFMVVHVDLHAPSLVIFFLFVEHDLCVPKGSHPSPIVF